MNKLDFKNDLLTKEITKLTDDALKPMSIVEIKEKFNLSFPFQVKRVKDSGINKLTAQLLPVGTITTIYEIFTQKGHVTNNRYQHPADSTKLLYQSADVQDYILHE